MAGLGLLRAGVTTSKLSNQAVSLRFRFPFKNLRPSLFSVLTCLALGVIILDMDNTNRSAEATYLAALESFRVIASAHRAVTLRYRNREIGDAAFLASRASQDEASKRVDAAEAAFVSTS